jgi:UTP:GlnB (protein PII) uridylyltransferase
VELARRQAGDALTENARGIHIARGLASAIESVVVDEYVRAVARFPSEGAALIAVGGFGRAEFAPYSDVDLLLLVPESGKGTALAHEIFTPLWDDGLEPATALRTADETLALAMSDHTAATALLDARPVAGDSHAARALIASFWERMQGDRLEAFINQKVEELSERRQRFGGSVYLLEPNVKTGVGGLRDLAGAMWIARARHRLKGLSGISHFGLLPRREIEALRGTRDMLWRIRCQLHLLARRKDERLTFAAQEQVARALGYRDTPDALGVELLMRDYYLAAHTVEHASDTLIDRCTKEYGWRKGRRPATPINEFLERWDDRVAFRDKADPAARPSLLVDLFVAAEREQFARSRCSGGRALRIRAGGLPSRDEGFPGVPGESGRDRDCAPWHVRDRSHRRALPRVCALEGPSAARCLPRVHRGHAHALCPAEDAAPARGTPGGGAAGVHAALSGPRATASALHRPLLP